MPFESAQGINFKFDNKPFTLTSVSFSKNVSEIDVSTLATKHGEFRTYRPAPLREGDELSIEFYGLELPQQTATAAISWLIDGTGSNASLTTGIPTAALCTSAQIQAAAGELIRGSATFRLTQS